MNRKRAAETKNLKACYRDVFHLDETNAPLSLA